MNLTEKQKEQLTAALQAAVFAAFAGAALIQEGGSTGNTGKKF